MNHLNDQQEHYHFCRVMPILSANKSERTPFVHTATESARLHRGDCPRLCALFLPEQLKRCAKPAKLFSCHCGRANTLLTPWKLADASGEEGARASSVGLQPPCALPLVPSDSTQEHELKDQIGRNFKAVTAEH